MDFYVCNVCGNLVVKLDDSGIKPSCCSQPMTALAPSTATRSTDEHLSVFIERRRCEGIRTVTIQVGQKPHSMTEMHHIKWVLIDTDSGFQIKYFTALQDPLVTFHLDSSESIIRIYAYCNLHGLWQREIYI